MKIIAQCSDGEFGRFICEISGSEIKHLVADYDYRPKVGQSVKVSNSWTRLLQLQQARAQFDAVQKKLVAISAALGPLANIVEPAKEPE